MVEGLSNFKYMGQKLDQTDDDWPAVRQKTMRARLVWGRLGTLSRREGEEPRVLAMFYRAVAQAVLLFGSETWVLLEEMKKKLEGTNTGFLIQITRKRARRVADGTWETPWAELVQEVAVTQLAMTYIGRRQETVSQWVDLGPLFELCAR